MESTSVSLLERLRNREDERAWQRFVALYVPVLRAWTQQLPVTPIDTEDLIQEILTLLVEKLPEFRYDPSRSFRNWLCTVSLNKWRELLRRSQARIHSTTSLTEDVPEMPDQSFWEHEHEQRLIRRAFQLLQSEFSETTSVAFRKYALQGIAAATVARDLGISVNSVYRAKSDVLRLLRQELTGFLE